jgi:hypothetical protein
MERFELSKAKGELTKCTTAKKKSKDEGKPVLTNDVHMLIVVDERSRDAVEFLFPGHQDVENAVAGRDGAYGGLKMQTKGDVGELNVTVYDGTGQNEIWKFERIGLQGQPTLLMNSLGDSRLHLRLAAKLSKKDMGKLVDYVEADIYISAEVSAPMLPGLAAAAVTAAAIEATQPLNGSASTPVQQRLDGAMTAEELLEFRKGEQMTRSDFVDWLAEKDISISEKSLQRYESGSRDVPDDVAAAVRHAVAQVKTPAVIAEEPRPAA